MEVLKSFVDKVQIQNVFLIPDTFNHSLQVKRIKCRIPVPVIRVRFPFGSNINSEDIVITESQICHGLILLLRQGQ
jgi:hypothetical protein